MSHECLTRHGLRAFRQRMRHMGHRAGGGNPTAPAVLARRGAPARTTRTLSGSPWALPGGAAAAFSMARRVRIRREGRRPCDTERQSLMTSSLSAVLQALELGQDRKSVV